MKKYRLTVDIAGDDMKVDVVADYKFMGISVKGNSSSTLKTSEVTKLFLDIIENLVDVAGSEDDKSTLRHLRKTWKLYEFNPKTFNKMLKIAQKVSQLDM